MKTICFDFDGVIASYDGWRGFDVLGQPNREVIELMRKLMGMGYYIVIFTTRPATQVLENWLQANQVPYNDINRNRRNPPLTSCKPIYHVIIDDRAINYHGQNGLALEGEIEKLVSKVGKG